MRSNSVMRWCFERRPTSAKYKYINRGETGTDDLFNGCESESTTNLGTTGVVKQNILQFQIPMADFMYMAIINSGCDLTK